jgi:hypothetical protein
VQAHQRLLKPEMDENRMAPWRGRSVWPAGAAGGGGGELDCDAPADGGGADGLVEVWAGGRVALAAAGMENPGRGGNGVDGRELPLLRA